MVGYSTEDHSRIDNLCSSGIQLYQIDRLHRRFFGLIGFTRANQLAIPRNQFPKKFLSGILFYFEFHMFFSSITRGAHFVKTTVLPPCKMHPAQSDTCRESSPLYPFEMFVPGDSKDESVHPRPDARRNFFQRISPLLPASFDR